MAAGLSSYLESYIQMRCAEHEILKQLKMLLSMIGLIQTTQSGNVQRKKRQIFQVFYRIMKAKRAAINPQQSEMIKC